MFKKDIIEETLTEKIIEEILPNIREKALEECSKITKDLTKNITQVIIKNEKLEIKETINIAHNKFKDVLELVNSNIPVMLTGGAGSGKSSTCEKIAEALGLEFYFSNAITQEYKLTGFIDANGVYQETQFYKAFKDGGLFVLDEVDASVPEALIILNTAIANKYFDFPNGKIKAHENFRIVACANTYGLGNDDMYVGRNQLDAASLDRFAIVKFDYDNELERNLTEDQKWVEFVQLLREKIKGKRIKHILSTRAIIYGDRLLKAGTEIRKVFAEIIFKNLELEDIKMIGKLEDTNRNQYVKEYNLIVEE